MSVVIVDPLPPGEWARHPAALAEDAYRDGWTQRLGGAPAAFPRQLTSGELTAWTRGHAAAHRATCCARTVGEPLRPPTTVGHEHLVDDVFIEEITEEGAPSAEDVQAGPAAPFFDGTQLCAQVDPEVFFPEKGGSPAAAKKLCATCEFQVPCLDYAMTHRIAGISIEGIWGGTTRRERDRRRLGREPLAAELLDVDEDLVDQRLDAAS